MSANSIKVQLELVRLLSQLLELFWASEPKQSWCSLSLPVKAAMWNQKRCATLITCFGKVYIPPDSSTGSKENLELWSHLCKIGSTRASKKKSNLKADFGLFILWLFFLSFIWNSGKEGQSTKQRKHWSNNTVLGELLCVYRSMLGMNSHG